MDIISFVDFLYRPELWLIGLVMTAVFATVMTLVLPYMQRSHFKTRVEFVTRAREELRAQRAKEEGGGFKNSSEQVIKQVVEQFNLMKIFNGEKAKEKLAHAGYRGPGPLQTYMFMRLVMPIPLFFGSLLYFIFVEDFGNQGFDRILVAFIVALGGYFLPVIVVSNKAQKRRKSITRAFPDALDLLLICVQSGMSSELAFSKVADEIGAQSIEMAEEMALTTLELSYLQERTQAYINFGKRTGIDSIKSLATSLTQAEHYGTPIGNALRVVADETRGLRMAEAERLAAALPPKLTVPMILFFLPALFVIIIGPAVITVMEML